MASIPSSLPDQPTTIQPVSPPSVAEGPLRLSEVRLIETTGQHSLRFRLSRAPEGVDYFSLRNPTRLVIDVKGAIESLPKVQRYKASDPLVTAVRIGDYQNRMRLVVDLKSSDTPPFSVDHTDSLVTVLIGEKNENFKEQPQAESNAQVLFLADDLKSPAQSQATLAASKANGALLEGKPSPLPLAKEEKYPIAEVEKKVTEPIATTSTLSEPDPRKAAAPTSSADSGANLAAKDTDHPKQLQEEAVGASSAPARVETNLAEENAWGIERVTQVPPAFASKVRRRKTGAPTPTTLALEENAALAADFKPERDVQYTGRRISLDFKNADLHDVLRIIAEVSGLNIVATDDVKARVTLRLVEVPWDQALDVVLQSNGLEKTQTGNVITVSTTKRLEAERNARLAAQNAQQKITPLATEYVKVNYVKATDLAALVTRESQQRATSAGAVGGAPIASAPAVASGPAGGSRLQQVALMSPRGTIAADSVSNVLIVRDLPENIASVRELIRNVDIQTPQVVIESYLVNTAENLNRDLGIQWGYGYRASPETGNATGVDFPGRIGFGGSGLGTGVGGVPFLADFPAAGVAPGSGGALDLLLGSLSGSQALDIRLSALEREGKARVISRPRVVTINNKPADIRSRRVVRVPIISSTLNVGGTGSNQGGGNAFQEFDVGITLKVTPQISSDGFVLLDIDAETSDLADASVKPTGSGSSFPLIPDTLTRTASSNVLIHSGDTFVLGGILQDDVNQQETGFPFLRDTPGLGWLFRSQSKSRVKSELLVFVTPKVVMSGIPGQLPTAQQLWEKRTKAPATENTMHQ